MSEAQQDVQSAIHSGTGHISAIQNVMKAPHGVPGAGLRVQALRSGWDSVHQDLCTMGCPRKWALNGGFITKAV
jgi:hypothetical protein